ncbi:diguanylate cyclase [Pantoea sp. Bo_2]|uniref:sensor domain-containing diguanylate cyclase n=1 Tax=unclassified Pantoea TaxID=2630326 RepID=UPI0012321A3A|nr:MULTISPECIES: diguanylate cyclase [unclassified Pantoea]KAA5939452.1 diguanylate cyclase [Pantoea sp. VH_3]KAA5948420.1 diguanylate cyclase [Pantoea sp. VH_25]KAA5951552.1 diguanylate cyclase [Pantoea sp. VH_24]KAA5954758.1 diguanylate cyclase [Pantoea sp. VH_16]KAA5960575.1 diguanylate cyclase [Pantoea sp. VH_18]
MLHKKMRLRSLLTLLSIGGVILTSGLLLSALLLFQKANIEDSLLEGNIAYARKLADTTDRYLTTAQRELAWSASQIKGLSNLKQLKAETERLRMQSGFFNSVVVVNHDAIIAATSPDSLNLTGMKLHSAASLQAITTRKPFISAPFTSAAGNYVVFLSQPLFSEEGGYLGYIGGTIYLKKQSMLSEILSQHFYTKGSTVSVVSNEGLIIFSHDPTLVGTKMLLSLALQKRLSTTESGHFTLEKGGKSYLTGYGTLQKTGWNVFITGTSETVRHILLRTAESAIWFVLGIILLTASVIAFMAGRIASPLEKLADRVRDGGSEAQAESLATVKTWYYEADRLKEAVQEHRHAVAGHLAALNDEAMTDPLTGLCNRRGFSALAAQADSEHEQCVIAIDIDHFKKINDWYGHDAGDAVLVSLAALLRQACRTGDIVSRFGGEEFILLLPDTTLAEAARTAERIRETVCATTFPFAGTMTISAGVASRDDQSRDREALLRRADEALYEAKAAGRNTVIIAGPDGFSTPESAR